MQPPLFYIFGFIQESNSITERLAVRNTLNSTEKSKDINHHHIFLLLFFTHKSYLYCSSSILQNCDGKIMLVLTRLLFLPILAILVLYCPKAHALPMIRDSETEAVLKKISAPIFAAASVDINSVNFYIVNDSGINAFVAGGRNIFMNSGLIIQAKSSDTIAGVIAHELGHITGGHQLRGQDKMDEVGMQAMLGYLLAGAAAAGGGGQAAAAVASASQQVAMRSALAFTRDQEQLADQAALDYLSEAGITARGLLSLLEKLRRFESMDFGSETQYMRTHPLSRERIAHVRTFVQEVEPKKDSASIAESNLRLDAEFRRVQAKLKAFLQNPRETIAETRGKTDEISEYARAIALYRQSNLAEADAILQKLQKQNPDDPYIHELRGQLLYESGQIAQSVVSYRNAQGILPADALINLSLAAALMELEQGNDSEISTSIKKVLIAEPKNRMAWQLKARLQDKQGNAGLANLSRAEEAFIAGDYEQSIRLASIAKSKLTDPESFKRTEELIAESKVNLEKARN